MGHMKIERVRKNLYIGKALDAWIEEKALEAGANYSAYVNMAMLQFKEQKEAMETARTGLPELMQQLLKMQSNTGK